MHQPARIDATERAELVKQARRLRADRWTYEAIGKMVGRTGTTVREWLATADPALLAVKVDRTGIGGSVPGVRQRLSCHQLQALHVAHTTKDVPVRELARQIAGRMGFASSDSAAMAIHRGWRMMGLKSKRAGATRCAARVRWGPNQHKRCSRYSLVGTDRCYMHTYPTDAAAHAAFMRKSRAA